MAILFADPAVSGPSIQSCLNTMQQGDSIQTKPGTFNEAAATTRSIDVPISCRDGNGTSTLDGQYTRQIGLNYAAAGKLTCTGLEVKNYQKHGILYNNPNVTGQEGTAGYQPLLMMNPASTYDIQYNEVHHIGSGDPSISGFNQTQWGIWVNAGHMPILQHNRVHHIGEANDGNGITCYWAYKPTIRYNECYCCHKDCLRYGYSWDAVVESNRIYGGWTGITHEFNMGARVANNFCYDCTWGHYVKQSNNDQLPPNGSNPRTNVFWGAALSLAGPAPLRRVGVWHNTVAGCIFNFIGLASQWFQNGVDVRNNLMVGLTYTDHTGAARTTGDAFIQDYNASPTVTGPDMMVDYNFYVTSHGSPAFFLTYGQNSPGGTNSAIDLPALQAWLGRGWEAHGQVVDPNFTDLPNKDLSYSDTLIGYNLTTLPRNPQGSPYGTQVGADLSTVPPATMKWEYVGMPTVHSVSGTSGGTTGRAVDIRYLTYWQSTTGGTGGLGVNAWMILDLGAPEDFNHVWWHTNLIENSKAKVVMLEGSNSPTGPWTNLGVTPGVEKWPSGTTLRFADGGQTNHIFELKSTVTYRYLRATVIDTFGKTNTSISGIFPMLLSPSSGGPPPPPPPPPPAVGDPGHRVRGYASAAR